jgi:hypothetical protein
MAMDLRARSWVPRLLALVALALVPWTLWLTLSLPSRHVTQHYDVAWIGFDVALAAAFAATAWSALRQPRWLVALAAATATMLLCDAWFDILTSSGGGERLEALAEATFAELPLAAICVYIVFAAERFQDGMRHVLPPTAAPGGALRARSDATGAKQSERRHHDRHA